MSRVSKACEFSRSARKIIGDRDGGECVFCKTFGYSGYPATQVMHFVPRSHNGRGIPENGGLGCVPHHAMLDNSDKREEMLAAFREYLQDMYPEWDEKKLVYDKWEFLKGG